VYIVSPYGLAGSCSEAEIKENKENNDYSSEINSQYNSVDDKRGNQ
jgi:hypothetical protein